MFRCYPLDQRGGVIQGKVYRGTMFRCYPLDQRGGVIQGKVYRENDEMLSTRPGGVIQGKVYRDNDVQVLSTRPVGRYYLG